MDAKQPVPGVTLIEVLKHKSTFDEPALKGILLPLADALERAHDAGKLHLSISPASIVLQGGATPVLVGFEAGAQAPTDPGYSAIERYSQEYRTGRWTDIYSLGAVAYRLVSGQPPPAAGARIEGEPMRSASEIGARSYHESLLQAIDWALKVHPLERPQNLAQWKDALLGLRETAMTGGAGAATTVPITATMVRKFAEARQGKAQPASAPQRPPASRASTANVTPIPPPLVEKPKPAPPPRAPTPAPKPAPKPTPAPPRPLAPASKPPPPPTATPRPKPIVPAPPVDEPFPESTPSRPSLLSAIIAVTVIATAIGYAWFAQRPKTSVPAVPTPQASALPAVTEAKPGPAPAPTAAPVPAMPSVPAPAPAPVERAPPQAAAPAVAPAPRVEDDPQVRLTHEVAATLQGEWVGRAAYSSVLRGIDCSASVIRTWTTSITGASADGKSLVGTFSTVLEAAGGNKCAKTRYRNEVAGDFTARVVSPATLQLAARVNGCNGDCDDNRGLLIYKTLNRTYRVAISPKGDRLSFSDNATDFALRRQR